MFSPFVKAEFIAYFNHTNTSIERVRRKGNRNIYEDKGVHSRSYRLSLFKIITSFIKKVKSNG